MKWVFDFRKTLLVRLVQNVLWKYKIGFHFSNWWITNSKPTVVCLMASRVIHRSQSEFFDKVLVEKNAFLSREPSFFTFLYDENVKTFTVTWNIVQLFFSTFLKIQNFFPPSKILGLEDYPVKLKSFKSLQWEKILSLQIRSNRHLPNLHASLIIVQLIKRYNIMQLIKNTTLTIYIVRRSWKAAIASGRTKTYFNVFSFISLIELHKCFKKFFNKNFKNSEISLKKKCLLSSKSFKWKRLRQDLQ